jgi:hypothetical protein
MLKRCRILEGDPADLGKALTDFIEELQRARVPAHTISVQFTSVPDDFGGAHCVALVIYEGYGEL